MIHEMQFQKITIMISMNQIMLMKILLNQSVMSNISIN